MTGAGPHRVRGGRRHVPPVGVGSGAGVVGSGSGAIVVVGGAGGGFGAVVLGAGAAGGGTAFVVVTGATGGGAASVVVVGSAGVTTLVGVVATGRTGVAFGAGRLARVAGFDGRALGAGAFFTVDAGCTFAVDVSAGVALAIAAASPPVAMTAPAATPLVTSDSRRRARSRWWAGG